MVHHAMPHRVLMLMWGRRTKAVCESKKSATEEDVDNRRLQRGQLTTNCSTKNQEDLKVGEERTTTVLIRDKRAGQDTRDIKHTGEVWRAENL